MGDSYQVDSVAWRLSACANTMRLLDKWLFQFDELEGGGRIKLDPDSIEARNLYIKADEDLHILMVASAQLEVSAFHKDTGIN